MSIIYAFYCGRTAGLGFVRPKQVLDRAVDKTWF